MSFLRPLPGWARAAALVGATLVSLGCGRTDRAAAEDAYGRSVDAMRARDYPAAVEAAREAIEADPGRADAWLQLGIAHSRMRQWPEAIEAYRTTIELDPQERRAANNLANVYFRQGLYDEAAAWYARALEIEPDYLLALFHYGWVLRQLNRLDEAERAFTHCLEVEPANERERARVADCNYYLGTILFRRADYDRAARVMEQIVALRPGHAEARHFLGQSYRHLGRLDEAAEQLEIHRRMLRASRGEPIPEPED